MTSTTTTLLSSSTDPNNQITLHQIIDDELLLEGFHTFAARFHAEETLMFWMSVKVFKHRNWKAAKFFGMDDEKSANNNNSTSPKKNVTTTTTTSSSTNTSKDENPTITSPTNKKGPPTTPSRARSIVL